MSRSGLKRHWDLVVVAVGGVLLLSMGGAILAAPLTLPLLYRAVRPDRAERVHPGVRAVALVVVALTVAEVAWAAVAVAATI
jgi:hypothetical protein